MPARHRKPNEIAQQTMPLVLLCAGMIATNSYLPFVDDEVRNMDAAGQPARSLFAQSFSGPGQHQIPVLYGILLHFWLRATAWNFDYLRIPSIAFFLVGLFLLGRAARRLAGPASASATIWLSILWPFGFFYGRLEAPYSFEFFLIAGVTFAYLELLESGTLGTSVALFLFGAALLWTDFFGWAILGCLAIDQLLRHFSGDRTIPARTIIRTVAVWIATAIPVLRPTFREFIADAKLHQGIRAVPASFAFHIYTLFVSESVAPWRWQLSVPAAIAVLICIVLVFMKGPVLSGRFLIYSAALLLLMAAAGTLDAGHLFFAAPWVLLAVAVAIVSVQSKWARPALAVALLIAAGVGWDGIYVRRYYSNPQFLETWPKVAADAADKIQIGATAISNSRPFFFYLTYALRAPAIGTVPTNAPKLDGLLPETNRQANITTPEQWLSSGHPVVPVMLWIHGASDPQSEGPMGNAARELDSSCGSREARLMVRDAGYDWKLRYLPQTVGPQWRIEARDYDCASSNSQQVIPIPPR